MSVIVKGGGGKPEEEKTVTAGTSAIEVLPSSGKVMKKVTVNPTPSETKTVTPKASKQTVSPSSGKLLSKVTVNGDADLVASNIKEGIDIFGVLGTLKEGVDLTSLGFTKWEIGEFTLASSSYNPTIKHSLGVVPKAILIRASSFPTSANRIHMYAALQADGGDYNAVFNYLNEYGPTYAAGGAPSFYSDKIVCTAQSSYKFINATPYKYIILY